MNSQVTGTLTTGRAQRQNTVSWAEKSVSGSEYTLKRGVQATSGRRHTQRLGILLSFEAFKNGAKGGGGGRLDISLMMCISSRRRYVTIHSPLDNSVT